MRHSHEQALSRLSAMLPITMLVVAASVAAWGLITGALRSSPDVGIDSDAVTGASAYIVRRPLDPVGWLSWAGARGMLTTDALRAAQVIRTAATLGPVDPQVLRAQAVLAFRQGDVDAGLNRAADLAVMLPTERSDAFATLRSYSGHPDWAGFWNARLNKGWPAVDAFLLDSCQSGASLSTLYSMVRPAVSKQPLDDAAVSCIGNKAIAEGQLPAAHWLWVNAMRTTPKSLGNVFNGDFEQPLAGRLFDWRLAAGGEYREGFSVSVSREDSIGMPGATRTRVNNNVLSVRFNGRALKMPIAQQFLALKPGRYVLAYKSRELGVAVPGRVNWTIRCVPANLTVALGTPKSEPVTGGWTTRVVDVMIPDACTGQLLDLEAGDRLQLLQGFRGTVLFDDISMKYTP